MNRTALVIGNGRYVSGPLKNPLNDAGDMAEALKRLGFDVTLLTDARHRDMEEALIRFGRRLKERQGAGLFYYAGHGMQVSGVNYLIPVGARIEKDSDLAFEALNLDRILAELAEAGNSLNFVLLDACRDNPFAGFTRSGRRGLSFVGQAPSGTFISYSTGANQTARDGEGRNSPYTAALLRYIEEPGLTVEEVFKKVRADLRRETGQVPWELSSLEGQFYFRQDGGNGLSKGGNGGSLRVSRKGSLETFTSPALGARFVLVPKGTFTMGSPDEEKGRNDDETAHSVTLTAPFYIQTTEVTQGQWKKVMGKNPSYFNDCGDDCPVEQVSWQDAQAFIKKLNELEKTTKYRLPTEAQWEYAARAGTDTAFNTGKCISTDVADYNGSYALAGCPGGKSRRSTVKTSGFPPNPWGLCDMHGNVLEWTADWKGDYPKGRTSDPRGPEKGTQRVVRGGSWQDSATYCRSAYRSSRDPGEKSPDLGFRLVRLP
jgi:formylglycine-generating enzyme required for sulfatase activity